VEAVGAVLSVQISYCRVVSMIGVVVYYNWCQCNFCSVIGQCDLAVYVLVPFGGALYLAGYWVVPFGFAICWAVPSGFAVFFRLMLPFGFDIWPYCWVVPLGISLAVSFGHIIGQCCLTISFCGAISCFAVPIVHAIGHYHLAMLLNYVV